METKEQMFHRVFSKRPARRGPGWAFGAVNKGSPVPRAQHEAILELLGEQQHLDWMLKQMRRRKAVAPFVLHIWAALCRLKRTAERDALLASITERAQAIDVPADLVASFERDWAGRDWTP